MKSFCAALLLILPTTFFAQPDSTPGASVRLSPGHVNFGKRVVGSSLREGVLVNLTNTGNADLTISSIAITGADSSDFFVEGQCPASLPPGFNCTLTVGFTPTTKGTRTGALTVTDNAANSPQTVSLRGVGTFIDLGGVSLDFGNQAVGTTSGPLTITLTNTGSIAVGIAQISIIGTDAGDFAESNTCGRSVAAGASCSITVTFTPSATGRRAASVAVTDNGGGSPQTVQLNGTGR